MAKPIPRNDNSFELRQPFTPTPNWPGMNWQVQQPHLTSWPLSAQGHQVVHDGLLARLFANISFGWRWVLTGLSALVGFSLSWYACPRFMDALYLEGQESVLVAGTVGLALVGSALYAVLRSDGLRQLESASTGVQLAALLSITMGALTFVALVITIALMVLAAALAIAILGVLVMIHDER